MYRHAACETAGHTHRLSGRFIVDASLAIRQPAGLVMLDNPYKAPAAFNVSELEKAASTTSVFSTRAQYAIIAVGMLLYFSRVLRCILFIKAILENEGATRTNQEIFARANSDAAATVVFAPIPLFLIWYGFRKSKRLQVIPRFDRFTIGWGVFASLVLVLVVMLEADYVVYTIQRPQHWLTLVASAVYAGYIYIWWCSSLAHGIQRTNQ